MNHADQIFGCFLGIAVGDAIGLPLENVSRDRIAAWLNDRPLGHRFWFGRGMVSDDTEHTCLVAQSITLHQDDPAAFGKDLAWRLKWWLAGLPAGTGRATAKACAKLWFTGDYARTGIFSAGNGPAMRAPVIGVAIADIDHAIDLTKISSQITHSDPKATYGALAVAAVAHHVTHGTSQSLSADAVVETCRRWIALGSSTCSEQHGETADGDSEELLTLIKSAAESAARGESTMEFAQQQGWRDGVTGYTYQTVPAALHACIRYPDDYAAAIEQLIH